MYQSLAIIVAVVAISTSGYQSVQSYNQTKTDKAAAEAGLEQCPIHTDSVPYHNVIWVKDCKAFLKENPYQTK